MKDFGLAPLLGYFLLIGLFVGISIHLFESFENAHYFYLLISLALTGTLSERNRNDFLKMRFSRTNYLFIRMMENMASSTPFIAFLLYKEFFLSSLCLAGATALFGLINFRSSYSLTVPTPFFRKPFEYTVGFRKTFLVFPMAYCITLISISVNNFNLGIFALLLIFLTAMTFYLRPENEYFVWSYSLTPEQFLKEKIRTGVTFSLLLALPVLIGLGFSFGNFLGLLLTILLSALGFLVVVILAKYSAYPNEIHVPQGILIAFCLFFPPFVLVIIPYFFFQSKKKLGLLLNDKNI